MTTDWCKKRVCLFGTVCLANKILQATAGLPEKPSDTQPCRHTHTPHTPECLVCCVQWLALAEPEAQCHILRLNLLNSCTQLRRVLHTLMGGGQAGGGAGRRRQPCRDSRQGGIGKDHCQQCQASLSCEGEVGHILPDATHSTLPPFPGTPSPVSHSPSPPPHTTNHTHLEVCHNAPDAAVLVSQLLKGLHKTLPAGLNCDSSSSSSTTHDRLRSQQRAQHRHHHCWQQGSQDTQRKPPAQQLNLH